MHKLICAPLFACFVVACAAPSAVAEKPNIVIIYADDIGYGDLSCYGATAVRTPNCDRLANEGIKFTGGYCTAATCTPSRYSLLTGEYNWRKRGTGIASGNAKMIIKPGRTTLASVLRDAGYKTAVVGKWHLGLGAGNVDWNKPISPGPRDIGFDYSYIMAATGDRVPCVYVEQGKVVGLDPDDPLYTSYRKPFPGQPTGKSHRDTLKMDWSHGHNATIINGISRIGHQKGGVAASWVDEDMADEFAGQAVKFIERNKDRPFFLFFATHDVHVPRVPHPRFVGKTKMGPRGDAIVQFDWQVGQILKTLDRLGLTDNTLVLVSSDNGPVLDDGYKDQAVTHLGQHKPAGPWRAGKYSVFEGGTRMPFIVRWPARIKPGESEAIISQVDFTATFAALTGQALADGDAPDSLNVLPALLGESDKGRDHVVQNAGGLTAIRMGDWKYIPPGNVRDNLGPWARAKIEAPGHLYNLKADPNERNNLAAKHPEKLAELRAKLEEVKAASKTRP